MKRNTNNQKMNLKKQKQKQTQTQTQTQAGKPNRHELTKEERERQEHIDLSHKVVVKTTPLKSIL